MGTPIKILLADDHHIVRNGIKLMLEHQHEFTPQITEATNGHEVIDLAEKTTFDIYLLDVSMPLMDGITTLRKLKKMNPDSRVIIFTMHNEEHFINQAIQAGALGYVLKQSGLDELTNAVLSVRKNETYYSSDIKAIAKKIETGFGKSLNGLTPRELEVLVLISSEMTSQEVADKLDISKRTVEGHRKRLIEKLNVKGTVGLIKYALKNGII